MKHFLILICIFCLFSCKEKKGVEEGSRRGSEDTFKKLASKVVPSESIHFSYHSDISTFGEKKGVVYQFINPSLDLENDSLTYLKANQLKELVRKEIANINDFNGFDIEFQKLDKASDSVIKQKTVIFKFNSTP